LYDYGFRDYAPRVARFTTVDPIKDGRNWYAYVGADPVNLVDPLGLASADDGEATGASPQLQKFGVGIGAGVILDLGFEWGIAIEDSEKPLIQRLDIYGTVTGGYFMGARGNLWIATESTDGGIEALDTRPFVLVDDINIGVIVVFVVENQTGEYRGVSGLGIGGGQTLVSRTTSLRGLIGDAKRIIEGIRDALRPGD